MNGTLSFTAITASGQAYDIDFPLHPQTRSAEAVSDLLRAVLDTISQHAAGGRDLSDGDVLQALTMALAIRARMVGSSAESAAALVSELCDSAFTAAYAAAPYVTGRA
ncbi:MAG: hypothetical protein AB1697_05225 [Pseudomonadota bacterium]